MSESTCRLRSAQVWIFSGETDTMADEEKIKKALEHRRCVIDCGRSARIHMRVAEVRIPPVRYLLIDPEAQLDRVHVDPCAQTMVLT